MKMTTSKLIFLRLFNVTFGRFRYFSDLLRNVLVKKMITSKNDDKYVASSRFFTIKDLD